MKSSSRAFPRGGRGEPKPLRTKGSSLSQPFRYANRIEVRTILRFSPRRGFCARPAKLLPLIRAVSTRDTPVRTEPSFPILVPLLFSFPPFTVSRLFPLSSSIAELFPPIGNNGATDAQTESIVSERGFQVFRKFIGYESDESLLPARGSTARNHVQFA